VLFQRTGAVGWKGPVEIVPEEVYAFLTAFNLMI
jgi:hypothetical protein